MHSILPITLFSSLVSTLVIQSLVPEALITPAPQLAVRQNQNPASICGYYSTNALFSLYCDPGTPCMTATATSPAVLYCRTDGIPVTTAYTWGYWPIQGCGPGSLCCAITAPYPLKYVINGGSTAALECGQVATTISANSVAFTPASTSPTTPKPPTTTSTTTTSTTSTPTTRTSITTTPTTTTPTTTTPTTTTPTTTTPTTTTPTTTTPTTTTPTTTTPTTTTSTPTSTTPTTSAPTTATPIPITSSSPAPSQTAQPKESTGTSTTLVVIIVAAVVALIGAIITGTLLWMAIRLHRDVNEKQAAQQQGLVSPTTPDLNSNPSSSTSMLPAAAAAKKGRLSRVKQVVGILSGVLTIVGVIVSLTYGLKHKPN